MGGGDTKTTQQYQSSETNPYAPTIPLLSNIIGSLGNIGTGVTGGQSNALTNLNNATGSLPDFSQGITSAINGMLNTNTSPQIGMLQDALKQYQGNIGGTAAGNDLDPYSTPGFSDAINTLTSDITKQVGSTYAGSGRDPSGAGSFSGSLGRGLTQGIAPVIQAQYNTNKTNQLNAANSLYSAGTGTAGDITQQQLSQLQAQLQGLQGAGAAPGLLTGNANAQLSSANAQYQQPYQNLGLLSGLLTPLAGLGGTSTGYGQSQTEQSKSLLSNILGGAAGLGGLNGALGGGWLSSLGSGIGGLLGLSDERAKDDITPVGETHDGQTLYSYTYKGDDTPQIGLLAQDVEKRDPAAVVTHPSGLKMVNYSRALAPSARLGMLKMAA